MSGRASGPILTSGFLVILAHGAQGFQSPNVVLLWFLFFESKIDVDERGIASSGAAAALPISQTPSPSTPASDVSINSASDATTPVFHLIALWDKTRSF